MTNLKNYLLFTVLGCHTCLLAQSIQGKASDTIELLLDSASICCPIADNSKIGMTIANSTDTAFTYGPDYYIEYYHQGKWKEPKLKPKADTSYAWEAVLLNIRPHTRKESWMGFFTRKHVYQPGKYRVRKEVTNAQTRQKRMLYAEFEITK